MINLNKSAIFFSKNTPNNIRAHITEISRIPNSWHLGKYLRLPTQWGRSKPDALNNISNKIEAKTED